MLGLNGFVADRLPDQMLYNLLYASRDSGSDRRQDDRQAFFAPFTIAPLADPQLRYSAFSRDVSATGIGLLHDMPLNVGALCVLRLHDCDTKFIRPAEVMWCRAAGEGWYLSGWRFLAPAAT
jgi:hypothetical protein